VSGQDPTTTAPDGLDAPAKGSPGSPPPLSPPRLLPPGKPRKPPIRSTASHEEFLGRILVLAKKLSSGAKKRELKAAGMKQWKVSARTMETYLSRAREMLLEETGKTRQEHIAEAYWHYQSVIEDPKTTTREKLEARAGIRELLGLDAPTRIDAQVSGGVIVLHTDLDVARVVGTNDGNSDSRSR